MGRHPVADQGLRIMKKSIIALALVAMSTALAGCHTQQTKSIEDRASFKGGPMPANVAQLISQRVQASEARAAAHK